MKTKSRTLSLAIVLILILSLAACGAASKSTSADETYSYSATEEAPYINETTMDAYDEGRDTTVSITPENSAQLSNDKIIYSGYAELETLDFDKTLSDLQQMINECNGFIQSSYVTGGDYDSIYGGEAVYRTADYSLRIPVEKFSSVADSLKSLGNVVSSSTNADNITMQYTDTQSRLDAYRTQETRLLELLAKATSVEDMLSIENSLSDVRYQIESLTSQIKNWDSQISYSTLSLSIREVALYSKDSSPTISYGEQLKQTFTHSLYGLGSFFKSLFRLLVAALPALFVLAVIALIVILIVKATEKKRKAKSASSSAYTQDSDSEPKN